MKISTRTSISFVTIFILFLAEITSSSVFFVVAIGMTIVLALSRNNVKLISAVKDMNCKYLIMYFAISSIIAIFNLLYGEVSLRAIIRDQYYVLRAITLFVLGYLLAYKYNKKNIYKTVVIWGTILGFINIVEALGNIQVLSSSESVNAVRSVIGNGRIEVVIAIFILSYTSFYAKEKIFTRKIELLLLVVLLFALIMTFSRSNIGMLLIMLCVVLVSNIHRINTKFIKYIGQFILIILVGLIIFYFLPSSLTQNFLEKLEHVSSEISNDRDWNVYSNVVQNWRGYEVYLVKNEFFAGNLFTKIWGNGFGKLVLTPYYYLVSSSSEGGIPYFHNGFLTVLYKGGIIGILLYISFFVFLLKVGRKHKNAGNITIKRCVLHALIIGLLFITFFTMGIFAQSFTVEFYLLIGWLVFEIKLEEKALGRKSMNKATYNVSACKNEVLL